jgi:hypothetical protein
MIALDALSFQQQILSYSVEPSIVVVFNMIIALSALSIITATLSSTVTNLYNELTLGVLLNMIGLYAA